MSSAARWNYYTMKAADLLLSSVGGSGPILMELLFSEYQNMNEEVHTVLCLDFYCHTHWQPTKLLNGPLK